MLTKIVIIKMFLSGNSKKYIISENFLSENIKHKQYTKIHSQQYVENILLNWWKNQ